MAQELVRTGRETVRSGLEDGNEVTYLGARQLHTISQNVEGCAKRPHNRGRFHIVGTYPVCDGNGIVLANHLAEIPRCGKVVMQTTVRNQEDLAPRHFAIQHFANVQSGFSDDVATELEYQFRAAKRIIQNREQAREVLADRVQVEHRVAGEVGNAESAANVDPPWLPRRVRREFERERQ